MRPDSEFRSWITADGSSGFKAESGRYHLYVSHACPWAHRTMILRSLKGLEKVISVTVVEYFLPADGWTFAEEPHEDGRGPDPVLGAKNMREVYLRSNGGYQGRITVPVLFDKVTKTIVNNESPEIIRMLNSEFNEFGETEAQRSLDLYPAELRDQVEDVNSWVYPNINNGVYRCGFATTQEAYDEAFDGLFAHLEKAEAILSTSRYLTGSRLTLADIRLFTTLLRFDAVYYVHFKTNLKRIADYPNLQNFAKEIYQLPGVEKTVNFFHIKQHYYGSHKKINAYGIVPKGPILDFSSPHDRSRL